MTPAPFNSFDVPGRVLSGDDLATTSREVMLHCCHRVFNAVRFQQRLYTHWYLRGGELLPLTRDDALAILARTPRWLVVNQESERASEATPADFPVFFAALEPWARSDWFFFDPETRRCITLTHDNQWYELAGSPSAIIARSALDTVLERFTGDAFTPDTPFPGRPSSDPERAILFQALANLIADPREAAFNDTPLRCHFRPKPQPVHAPLPLGAATYIIAIERSSNIHTATISDLQHYFASKRPWEANDFYLIDPLSPHRCLCITHDDAAFLFDSHT
jgi:hypothetical protein